MKNLKCFSVSVHRLLIATAVAALVGLTAGPSVADDLTPQEAQKIATERTASQYPVRRLAPRAFHKRGK